MAPDKVRISPTHARSLRGWLAHLGATTAVRLTTAPTPRERGYLAAVEVAIASMDGRWMQSGSISASNSNLAV